MIVPAQLNEEPSRRSVVTLAHYARAVQYTECAIYGVQDPNAAGIGDQCRDIWTLDQRNYILRYLEEAQIELEDETKHLFGSTWVTGELTAPTNRLTDVKTYRRGNQNRNLCSGPAVYTRWNNVKAVGKLVPVELGTTVTVSHAADPAFITLTIDPAVVTDIYKVRIFESGNYGTDKAISLDPSSINISGTDLNIEIPRCRMVKYALRNNPSGGLDYADTNNFVDEVDVYYYTTVNTDSLVVTRSNCNCSTREETGCLQIVTTGVTTVRAATSCELCPCTCNCDDIYAGFYYEAGDAVVDQRVIDTIIRLAHAKMPTEPCGCEIAQRLWTEDRDIPNYITPERAKCPFGLNNGSWIAWKWAQGLKKLRLGHG